METRVAAIAICNEFCPLISFSRNQGSSKSDNEHEKYVRLFIVCPKTATEDELREEFEQWGTVEHVTLVKDKQTGNPKGFGYIRYPTFYNAAVAFENCPSKYKAVFAEPKGTTQRNQRDQYGGGGGRDDNNMMGGRGGNSGFGGGGYGGGNMGGMGGGGGGGFNNGGGGYNNDWGNNSFNNDMSQFLRMQNVQVPQPTCLEVVVSTCVNQDQLWRLFDIIPGLDYCQITKECKYAQK